MPMLVAETFGRSKTSPVFGCGLALGVIFDITAEAVLIRRVLRHSERTYR